MRQQGIFGRAGYRGFGDTNPAAEITGLASRISRATQIAQQAAPALYYSGAFNAGQAPTQMMKIEIPGGETSDVPPPAGADTGNLFGLTDTQTYLMYGGVGVVALVGLYFIIS